ncbi:MAG: hypothetical protein HY787_25510 [Deltaproteobacteria bacterium]|nr:hypothetical protein [Deltaproteobacteria bacterium]
MTCATNPSVRQQFPNLDDSNHSETSPRSTRYNCIAWAAGDCSNFWWPKYGYWPSGVSSELTIDSFIEAFQTLGYQSCNGPDYEPSFEKIAIYAKSGSPTHAARQLASGRWTSKLGKYVDIEHSIDALDGPAYGTIEIFMKRQVT